MRLPCRRSPISLHYCCWAVLALAGCGDTNAATNVAAEPVAKPSAEPAADAHSDHRPGHRSGWVAPQTNRYDAAVLADVARSVDAARAAGTAPVVVFDLDHTLYDGRPRTLMILAEFAATLPVHQQQHGVAIRSLSLDRIAYLLGDTLGAAGIIDPAVVKAAEDHWKPRFFSDDYLQLDVPLPGAVAYVQDLWQRGAVVVYLSGRNAPAMLRGTTASLQQWGFPIGVGGTQLVLKPAFDMADEAFKHTAFAQISALGTVVASFENEPGNLGAMATAWPEALPVFLDTDFNPGGAAKTPPDRARWVPDYSRYVPPAR